MADIKVLWAVQDRLPTESLEDRPDNSGYLKMDWLKRVFGPRQYRLKLRDESALRRFSRFSSLWSRLSGKRAEIVDLPESVEANEADIYIHSDPRALKQMESLSDFVLLLKPTAMPEDNCPIVFPMIDPQQQALALSRVARLAKSCTWDLVIFYKHIYAAHPWRLSRFAVELSGEPMFRLPYYDWEETSRLNSLAELIERVQREYGIRVVLQADSTESDFSESFVSYLSGNLRSVVAIDNSVFHSLHRRRMFRKLLKKGFSWYVLLRNETKLIESTPALEIQEDVSEFGIAA